MSVLPFSTKQPKATLIQWNTQVWANDSVQFYTAAGFCDKLLFSGCFKELIHSQSLVTRQKRTSFHMQHTHTHMHACTHIFSWLSVPTHLEILAGCSSHAIRSKHKIYTRTQTHTKTYSNTCNQSLWTVACQIISITFSGQKTTGCRDTPLVTQVDMW